LIGAKADAQTICVDPALKHENVSLVTNAKVMRLETNGNARQVSKVIVERNGAREEYSGDIVVVSCGAVNSSALLLRSANDSHPNGLANGSDVVGRHYMGHINSVLMALSKCPNPTVFQKRWQSTISISARKTGNIPWATSRLSANSTLTP
jgi:choline dehydrogenase-like flavoprotein